MNFLKILSVICALIVAGNVAARAANDHGKEARKTLFELVLDDGASVTIIARIDLDKPKQTASVEMRLFRKGEKDQPMPFWTSEIGSLEYSQTTENYLGLVNVNKDNIYIYTTWNDEFVIVDRSKGKTVKKGRSDDTLGNYASFIPLKVIISKPCVGKVGKFDGP